MDITPYLKLLTSDEASIVFKGNAIPRYREGDDEKAVGTTAIPAPKIMRFVDKLLSNSQQLDLSLSNEVRFPLTSKSGEVFIFIVDKSSGQMKLTVLRDPRKEREPEKAKKTSFVIKGAPDGDKFNIMPYLEKLSSLKGSDLFLTAHSTVKFKDHGQITDLSEFILTSELILFVAKDIMTDKQYTQYMACRDIDFAIALPDGSARFRVNAFYQRGAAAMVFRLIPSVIPTFADLNLPTVLSEVILNKRGLVLLVGGTGSGKSTTMAAMINYRNSERSDHILTIEDPVEFSHPNIKSIVNQREVGTDTESYEAALKASLREAPDVILIGEIRTRETMEAALELANTGHLCLSTLHANNANQAMERIINLFPHEQHKQLFMDLSSNLVSIASQRLIPSLDGKRVAAIEILMNTPLISNLLLKGQTNEIKEAMISDTTGGSQTFDEALLKLYKDKKITREEAIANADSQNDMETKINFS